MNKKITIIALSSLLLLTGCGNNVDTNKNINTSVLINSEDDNQSVSTPNTDDYETIGEILAFEDQSVHILTGDVVQIFPVSEYDLKHYYLGQTVMVQQELEDMYSLLPFKQEDFERRYTNMGDQINRYEGILKSVEDNIYTFDIDGQAVEFEYVTEDILELNGTYEFDTIQFSDMPIITHVFSDRDKFMVTIEGIDRNEEGQMILRVVDTNNLHFSVDVSQSILNFNYQDLAVGHQLDIYSSDLKADDLNQPIRIDLLSPVSKGLTSIDYEVIGDVIAIDGSDLHVLSGDMVNIFYISQGLEAIHLGEKVHVYGEEGQINVEPYIVEDFSNRFDTMGNRIQTVSGQVIDIIKDGDQTTVTLVTDHETLTLSYYGQIHIEKDNQYELDLVSYVPGEKVILNYYHENMILDLVITEINMSEQKELMITAEDGQGGIYIVSTAKAYKNFNLSSLKVDDTIEVYAKEIMESFPMQVNPDKILIQ